MGDRPGMRTVAVSHRRAWGALFLVAVMAAAGGILLASMIPHGIGLSSDSLLYVTGAESLRDGDGWSQPSGEDTRDPVTHFPPLYPVVLAVFAGSNGDVLATASAVAVLLFVAVILAAGAALIFIQGDEIGGVLAAVLLAASPILSSIFTWAMSEPLFLFLGLASLASLAIGLRRNGIGWFILAGVAAGLAYLARYVGVSLVLSGGLILILKGGWSRQDRTTAMAAFVGPPLLAVAAWSARNLLLTGTATNRTLAWHAPSITKWKSPFALVWAWLFPSEFDVIALWVTAVVIAAVALLAVVFLARHWPSARRTLDGWRQSPSLVVVVAMYGLGYAGIVGFSLMFVDAATPVDHRIAAPVYLSFVMVLSAAWALGYRRWPRGSARPMLLLVAAAVVISHFLRTSRLETEIRGDGQGFASGAWRASPIITAAKTLPPDALVYTDNKEIYTFFTGVGAYGLPAERDGVTGLANPETPEILAQILERLEASGGAVVLFGGRDSVPGTAYLAPLLTRLDLLVSTSDGQVYYASRTE